jgi:hypothetical protein
MTSGKDRFVDARQQARTKRLVYANRLIHDIGTDLIDWLHCSPLRLGVSA